MTTTDPTRPLNLPEHVDDTDRRGAINVAVGAASVCWETPEGAGVFDSDRALTIATELEAWLDRHDRTRWLDGALLGLVSTEQLLDELAARVRIDRNEAAAGLLGTVRWLLSDAELAYRTSDA